MSLVRYSNKVMTAERSIHLASRHSLASVKDILEKEPNAYQSKDEDGRYPIHHAVTTRKLDIVEFLLQLSSGQQSLLRDENGWTPLHIAASIGSLEIIRVLLESAVGAAEGPPSFVDMKTSSGNTALHYCSSKNHADCVEFLLAKGGADPSQRDNSGQTPLHRASALGHSKIVDLIVTKSPSIINYQDREKQTSLHLAMEEGRIDVVLLLLERGADQSIENVNGQIPVQLASDPFRKHLEQEHSNLLIRPSMHEN